MSLQLLGKITHIGDRETKSDTFTIRGLHIKTIEKYPQPVAMQLTQDRCDVLDDFSEGDVVTVHFDIAGHVWNDRIINNMNVWKIEGV